jgi:SAM-dependent methyltransferase
MFQRKKIVQYIINLLTKPSYWHFYYQLIKDKIKGVDISRMVYANELEIPAELEPTRYEATAKKPLTTVLSELTITNEDIFIDFGCGKGYALMISANYPFRQIRGIEFSKSVFNIALQNLKSVHPVKIQVIYGNAAEYTDLDDITCFYFFNPFGPVVLRAVLQNIEKSLQCKPRPAFLIYNNPVHASVIGEFTTWKILKQYAFKKENGIWVYVNSLMNTRIES